MVEYGMGSVEWELYFMDLCKILPESLRTSLYKLIMQEKRKDEVISST